MRKTWCHIEEILIKLWKFCYILGISLGNLLYSMIIYNMIILYGNMLKFSEKGEMFSIHTWLCVVTDIFICCIVAEFLYLYKSITLCVFSLLNICLSIMPQWKWRQIPWCLAPGQDQPESADCCVLSLRREFLALLHLCLDVTLRSS